MLAGILVIIALLAIGWWLNHRWAAAKRKRDEEDQVFERHDHARALDNAKAQADLQRWSGPH